ncbi:MAG: XRE family transcriptional regulator [Treponema sp.]|nr:XRE family transcriptional regulator [Treponema sp.]
MSFWENVENELKFQCKTKKELSINTGINLQSLHKSFERNSEVSAINAVKIARNLGVSVEYLVTGQDSSLQKENLDLHRYREYSSFINQLDSLPENQRELIKSIVAKMNGWKN